MGETDMFNRGKENNNVSEFNKIDTILGESAVLEGVIKTSGTTRVDGRIKGEAKSEGLLIIGESGYIEGDVTAEAMLIAGQVKGQIHVKDRLEIADTGKVTGDIYTKKLVISEGAAFEGKCVMTEEKVVVKTPTPVDKGNDINDGQKRVGTN